MFRLIQDPKADTRRQFQIQKRLLTGRTEGKQKGHKEGCKGQNLSENQSSDSKTLVIDGPKPGGTASLSPGSAQQEKRPGTGEQAQLP